MSPDQAPRRRGRPRGFDAENGPTIQALARALDVLEALARDEGPTLTELATKLDQSPATLHRVLATLEAHGMAEIDTARQGWHVGPRAFLIGSAFLRRTNVVERARPVMRELMQATGETANLGIARDGIVTFLSQVETHHAIRAFFPPGTTAPMHASGIGKALLAHSAPDVLTRYLRFTERAQFTPRTITEAEALQADLAQARSRGWALDDEEKTEGMRCVAAAILNAHGEAVAGISVSGPSNRMRPERLKAVGALVRAAAMQISAGLGWPGHEAPSSSASAE